MCSLHKRLKIRTIHTRYVIDNTKFTTGSLKNYAIVINFITYSRKSMKESSIKSPLCRKKKVLFFLNNHRLVHSKGDDHVAFHVVHGSNVRALSKFLNYSLQRSINMNFLSMSWIKHVSEPNYTKLFHLKFEKYV